MENLSVLEEPFRTAFLRGDNIDYKLVKGASKTDHYVVKELGYEAVMAHDCSYYTKGLPGLYLSSYGDWGEIICDFANDTSKELFLKMVSEKTIKLWRITSYIKTDSDVKSYTYDDETKVWKIYDKEQHKWSETEAPEEYRK